MLSTARFRFRISPADFQESEKDLRQSAVHQSDRLKLKSAELGLETYSATPPTDI